jgi:hypothetical protein
MVVGFALFAFTQAVLEHFRKAGVGDLEFLAVLEGEEVHFLDSEHPQELAE